MSRFSCSLFRTFDDEPFPPDEEPFPPDESAGAVTEPLV